MTKGQKIVLGVFTLWPIIYCFSFIVFAVSMAVLSFNSGEKNNLVLFVVLCFFILHLLTILEVLTLIAIYIVNVFKNERVVGDKKALWAVVLFLGAVISMPIYWYLYIWKEKDNKTEIK